MRRAVRLTTVLLLLCLLGSCSKQARSSVGPSPSEDSPTAVSAPKVRTIKDLRLGRDTEAVSGNANRLVYGARQPGDLDDASVMSLELQSGARSRVGHSEFRHGLVNWAGASGAWTIFTDQSHIQGNGPARVLWRVVAVNPALHERRILQSNGEKPDPWVPWLGSRDDYVYWSSAESDARRTAREWIWRYDWPRPRSILRHAELAPGSESIGGGSMVYLGPQATTAPRKHVGGDCWRVPLTGGSPEPLTHTGLADGCATDGTWLVWETLIPPDTSPTPEEGLLDDPYEVWAQRIDKGVPELLHRGYIQGGWPLVQSGFAVYQSDSGPVIQDLADPKSTKTVDAEGWDLGATVGDRLALTHPAGEHQDEYVAITELSRRR